jgi:hypothetical protein
VLHHTPELFERYADPFWKELKIFPIISTVATAPIPTQIVVARLKKSLREKVVVVFIYCWPIFSVVFDS